MRVTGTATLSQPPSAVWPALNDPAVLARAIPGCERLDVTGPGTCTLTVLAGIAAVAGSYAGEALAAERTAPGLIRATVSGSGNRGQVGAEVTVRLVPSGDAATEVSYEADIRAEGPVAVVGQRVVASVAKRLAAQFLDGIERSLAMPAGEADEADESAAAAGADEAKDAGEAGGDKGAGSGGAASAASAADQGGRVIELARRGIGVRGAAAPAGDPPAPERTGAAGLAGSARLRPGLAAGAAAVLAGIVIGILLGRRARAARR